MKLRGADPFPPAVPGPVALDRMGALSRELQRVVGQLDAMAARVEFLSAFVGWLLRTGFEGREVEALGRYEAEHGVDPWALLGVTRPERAGDGPGPVPGGDPVSPVAGGVSVALGPADRVGIGFGCTWWGGIDEAGSDQFGRPVCPWCAGELIEVESYEQWILAAERSETEHGWTNWVGFVNWLRERGGCEPDPAEAAAKYQEATGLLVDRPWDEGNTK